MELKHRPQLSSSLIGHSLGIQGCDWLDLTSEWAAQGQHLLLVTGGDRCEASVCREPVRSWAQLCRGASAH